jgi:16S rRNA (guanine527-N7)-methyltransferase
MAVLAEAQRLGYVGGRDLEAHVRQAEAFAAVVGEGASPVLDLGSGGGLPGLVLAAEWPAAHLTLLDGSSERCAFLTEAVAGLDLSDRVTVAVGRAEALGHDDGLRGRFEVVVSRSFGAPAVVAECAAPFLAEGGRLVVSEPPNADGSRWAHADELAEVGLVVERLVAQGGFGFQFLRLVALSPSRYPRRTGVPTKRPLF